MNFLAFLKKSFFLFILFAILLAFFKAINILSVGVEAAWAGLVIAFLNSVMGAAIIGWGIEKPDKQFYGAFFGGMIVRLIIIFAVLFILIKIFDFNRTVLVVSLLLTYFSFLILEIWAINQYAALRGKEE